MACQCRTRRACTAGRLWLLESGNGGLGVVDPSAGRYESLTRLPGFTRGLDFCGHLAFVGLSQVRESAVFSGIPIAQRALAQRNCGVWVVDLRTGQTVAFLRFEDAVQEVFAVQVLPGVRCPDVVSDDPMLAADCYDVPAAALQEVPLALRRFGKPVLNGDRGTGRGRAARMKGSALPATWPSRSVRESKQRSLRMSLVRWLASFFSQQGRSRYHRRRRPANGCRYRSRLTVTALEDRLAPAILTVTSLD